VLIALGLFAATALPLNAAEPLRSGQWWGTFELGAGQLDRTMPGFSDNSARFYLGLGGGMAVDPHLLLGIEASGWLIQAENANDPTKGAGISRVFAVARIYPQATSNLHLQLGAGSITGWDNSPWSLNHTGHRLAQAEMGPAGKPASVMTRCSAPPRPSPLFSAIPAARPGI